MIKWGAVSVIAAVTAVSAAAVKASTDSAEALDKIAKDSKRLGVSTQDLSVLGFAAEREGIDPEKVTKGIARIGNQFTDVRNRIAQANSEFGRLKQNATSDAWLAAARGDRTGFLAAADKISAGRSGSLDAIRERRAQAQAQLNAIAAYPAADLHQQLQQAEYIQKLQQEISDLDDAEGKLRTAYGPAGEALLGLEKYGVDIQKVTKGGVEGFAALGEAIKQVADPTERLRYATLLFGEDDGPKMLTILLAGRAGLEAYRKEAEKYGIVVDEVAAKQGEAFEDSKTNFGKAIEGAKMAVARVLLPSLTDANQRMADFIAAHRDRIAALVKRGYDAMANFASDVVGLWNGQRDGFKTPWLDAIVAKAQQAYAWVQKTGAEFVAAWNGQKSGSAWIDALASGIRTAVAAATDLFKILTGKDAVNFPWLNKLRDDTVAFAKEALAAVEYYGGKLFDAMQIVIDAGKWIKDHFLQPLADLFGWDLTTSLFVLGFAKWTGMLGFALSTLGLIKTMMLGIGELAATGLGLKTLASVLGGLRTGGIVGAASAWLGRGAGAAAGAGAAEAVGAGVAGAVGAAAGWTPTPALTPVGYNVAGGARAAGVAAGGVEAQAGAVAMALSRVVLPVAIVAGGAAIGAGIGSYLGKLYGRTWDALGDKTAELIRTRDEVFVRQRDQRLLKTDPAFIQQYWAGRGVTVDDVSARAAVARMNGQPVPYPTGPDVDVWANAPAPYQQDGGTSVGDVSMSARQAAAWKAFVSKGGDGSLMDSAAAMTDRVSSEATDKIEAMFQAALDKANERAPSGAGRVTLDFSFLGKSYSTQTDALTAEQIRREVERAKRATGGWY